MPLYRVAVINTVSTVLEVEADDPAAAVDAVFDHPDMPGELTITAFGPGDHPVDADEWQVESVTSETGEQVWRGEALQ